MQKSNYDDDSHLSCLSSSLSLPLCSLFPSGVSSSFHFLSFTMYFRYWIINSFFSSFHLFLLSTFSFLPSSFSVSSFSVSSIPIFYFLFFFPFIPSVSAQDPLSSSFVYSSKNVFLILLVCCFCLSLSLSM